ncbi:polysaccharide deacetylase family protein [Echinicola marina]|uniref:polysaccharide deacetylase family protein n=1 Tax=Echinicola marina TaxID=2859768 RepID=UPI001CF68A59|nr:polysaccharide deacetylase family protein [Echinicola marina]UCS93534.1 polysaccharide deacetylase family protein [Echinicola marina]
MMIHFVPKPVKWLFPKYVWNKSRAKKEVYLTFDDGPVPSITPFVLDELKKRGMHATFFMVGDNICKSPDLARRVIAEGHQIGNHTYNHLNGAKEGHDSYINNLQKCQQTIKAILGIDTCLFRPPYGRLSGNLSKSISKDFQIIMWEVLSGDFIQGIRSEQCLQKTIKYTKSGSIILFHDQEKTEKIINEVLPPYLDYLKSNGFKTALL